MTRLRDTAGIVAGNFGRRFLRLDLFVDFSPMNRNLFGSFNSEAHLVATDSDHRDDDVIPDHDALLRFAGQDEHVHSPTVEPRRPAHS